MEHVDLASPGSLHVAWYRHSIAPVPVTEQGKTSMKRTISCLVIATFAWSAQAAETGTIAEVYGCTYREGKSLDDLKAAAAQWLKEFDKVEAGKNYYAAILSPIRSNSPYDVVWIGSNPNLNDWAKSEEASTGSAALRASQAGFDAVADCSSGLYWSATLLDELPVENDDNDAVVEVYACNTSDGKTAADIEAAEKLIVEASKGLKFATYRLTPWLANTTYDRMYLSVSDDLGAFAANNSTYLTSSAGANAEAAVYGSQSCKAGLWHGHVIRRPAPDAR